MVRNFRCTKNDSTEMHSFSGRTRGGHSSDMVGLSICADDSDSGLCTAAVLSRRNTEAEIKDLFTQALSQRDLAELFRNEIIPKSEETLEVSLEAYRVGQSDFLQLVDNWRQLLKFGVMLSQQESQLRQTLSTSVILNESSGLTDSRKTKPTGAI